MSVQKLERGHPHIQVYDLQKGCEMETKPSQKANIEKGNEKKNHNILALTLLKLKDTTTVSIASTLFRHLHYIPDRS